MTTPRLRSQIWFHDPSDPGDTASTIDRYTAWGLTRAELQSGRPVIGIAQSGSELTPCNRIHLSLAARIKDGIREAGGIPIEFPLHPIQETCRRPTAALDRNLAYLGLVEILCGYPFDGVVLTTACDKTTPACLMAAASVNIPAIVLSGGPMADSYYNGKLTGSGMAIWEARRQVAAGEITLDQMVDITLAAAPGPGHCNTMGTALSMNSLAEALGMSLPGCAAIPAPHGERARMAYLTGQRIVGMVHEDLKPSRILTRAAFENAIVVNSAIGGSTNCAPHLLAIARHMGVPLTLRDFETIGYSVPLLVNVQPAGDYLGEGFHRAGAVPAVMAELLRASRLQGDALTVTGHTVRHNIAEARILDENIIRPLSRPLRPESGFLILHGNLFDSAVIKTSVISPDFRRRFLSTPGDEEAFTARVIVFDGPEDYRRRIDDPALAIDETCMLVVRGTGPLGYPGSAEVVNMRPPGDLIREGVRMLPCMGDGRQSGTSDSPSILHVTPESAAGGNIALLSTGDHIRVDLKKRELTWLVSEEEIQRRRQAFTPEQLRHDSPWQQLYRAHVGQLDTGACLEFAVDYRNLGEVEPRRSH